jgi:hypothetical protein
MRMLVQPRFSLARVDLVHKQGRRRVFFAARDKEHPLAALRKKSQCIHYAIRPAEAPLLQRGHEAVQCSPPVEMQHEGDVLENEPHRATGIQQPEHVTDERGARATDPGSAPCLAQVLAGESRTDDTGIARQTCQVTNIAMIGNIRESRMQY